MYSAIIIVDIFASAYIARDEHAIANEWSETA